MAIRSPINTRSRGKEEELKYLVLAIVLAATPAHAERCLMTWYGAEMHGRNADGSRWQPQGISVAHRSLPFGTVVEVCRRGVCGQAVVKDRGPRPPACLDLSHGFARSIGLLSSEVLEWHVVGRSSNSARVSTRRQRARIVAPPVFNLFNIFK